jgi:hypothetical protein
MRVFAAVIIAVAASGARQFPVAALPAVVIAEDMLTIDPARLASIERLVL